MLSLKTSLNVRRFLLFLQNADVHIFGLVALCLRQQLQRQRGMERGEGGCVDGEKGRGKRGGRGEKFFVNWYNQLT